MKKKEAPDLGRCTGHCCRKFYIPRSHESLLAEYDAWLKGDKEFEFEDTKDVVYEEIHIIGLMVRPLNIHGTTKNRTNKTETFAGRPTYAYRCVHIQENNDCGIYDRRPNMCRKYPSYGKCTADGCTWGEKRKVCEHVTKKDNHAEPKTKVRDRT